MADSLFLGIGQRPPSRKIIDEIIHNASARLSQSPKHRNVRNELWVAPDRRIVTAGGIASGMEMGFHLLRRAGYDETFISEVARVMEYKAAYDLYRDDIEYAN